MQFNELNLKHLQSVFHTFSECCCCNNASFFLSTIFTVILLYSSTTRYYFKSCIIIAQGTCCTHRLQTLHSSTPSEKQCICDLDRCGGKAQTVLLSNAILLSVTIFHTVLNTLSGLALLCGMRNKVFKSLGSSLSL